MKQRTPFLDDLWTSVPRSRNLFDPVRIAGRPAAVRRYLEHAIAPGTPVASAVRLQMHGEIKLGGWRSFSAEEVICWGRGMIWRAAVRVYGIPISGSDSLVDGSGVMRWKLFDVIPFINASGPDISRSAAGRVNIESLWLPSVLCDDKVEWTAPEPLHLHAVFTAHGERAEIDFDIDASGRLDSVVMPRWGNRGTSDFRYVNFGGFVDEEGVFGGYTIPVRLRVGWRPLTRGFDPEGEFFRCVVDDAAWR